MTVVRDMAHVQGSPLFSSLHPVLERVDWPTHAWPTLADYQAVLDALPQPVLTASGVRLKITPQASIKSEGWQAGYEPRIYLTGELQTRLACWHDAFNLLAWASFPKTKAALNARHFVLQQARAKQGRQTLARDAGQDTLTQFDETGVIVLSSDTDLLKQVDNFDWKSLFWTRRSHTSRHMRCLLLGHGLMEKALTPYIGMTGKAVLLHVSEGFLAAPPATLPQRVDALLADRILSGKGFDSPRMLAPFPVLGFPGFWPDQQCESFYDNREYFRAGRVSKDAAAS